MLCRGREIMGALPLHIPLLPIQPRRQQRAARGHVPRCRRSVQRRVRARVSHKRIDAHAEQCVDKAGVSRTRCRAQQRTCASSGDDERLGALEALLLLRPLDFDVDSGAHARDVRRPPDTIERKYASADRERVGGDERRDERRGMNIFESELGVNIL